MSSTWAYQWKYRQSCAVNDRFTPFGAVQRAVEAGEDRVFATGHLALDPSRVQRFQPVALARGFCGRHAEQQEPGREREHRRRDPHVRLRRWWLPPRIVERFEPGDHRVEDRRGTDQGLEQEQQGLGVPVPAAAGVRDLFGHECARFADIERVAMIGVLQDLGIRQSRSFSLLREHAREAARDPSRPHVTVAFPHLGDRRERLGVVRVAVLDVQQVRPPEREPAIVFLREAPARSVGR